MRLHELEQLAFAIAPELATSPLYVVASPSTYPTVEGCEAFASPSIDCLIRKAILDADEWDGPGAMIVFSAADRRPEDTFGILLHELAHLLPFTQATMEDVELAPERFAHQAALIRRWATEPEADNGRPPWLPGHGLPFIRAVLHLHFRAEQLGHEIPLPAVSAAGPRYGLSGLWRYRRALGDEPQRMVERSFTEILTSPAPQEFGELFHEDVTAWYADNSTNKEPIP